MEGYWNLFMRTGNPLACLLFLRSRDGETADDTRPPEHREAETWGHRPTS